MVLNVYLFLSYIGGALVICYSIFYLVTDRRLPAIETTIPLIGKFLLYTLVVGLDLHVEFYENHQL